MLRLQVAPTPVPSQAAHGSIAGSRPSLDSGGSGTPSPGGCRESSEASFRGMQDRRMRMRNPVVLHSRHGRWAESAPRWAEPGSTRVCWGADPWLVTQHWGTRQ
jgi:hypothetical protein